MHNHQVNLFYAKQDTKAVIVDLSKPNSYCNYEVLFITVVLVFLFAKSKK